MQLHKGVLSEETLRKLFMLSRDRKQPARTNFFNYQPEITGFSNAVFAFDMDEDLKNIIADELVAKQIFSSRPKIWECFKHVFSRYSYIPWHDDSRYCFTGTVYLNPQWDRDMGGMFVHEDGNELKAILPQYNTGIFFVPPLQHTTTITAINAPMRESLQIFVTEFENEH